MVHFIALYSTDEKAREGERCEDERTRWNVRGLVSTSIAVVVVTVKVAGMQKKGRGYRISIETRELRENTRACRGF